MKGILALTYLVCLDSLLVMGSDSQRFGRQSSSENAQDLLGISPATSVPTVLPTIQPTPVHPIPTCCSSCYLNTTTDTCFECPAGFYCNGEQKFACTAGEYLGSCIFVLTFD